MVAGRGREIGVGLGEDGSMQRLSMRRKRVRWRLGGLAVVGAVVLTYRLTLPPELVWWTSPEIPSTGRHAKILIPRGMYGSGTGDGQVNDGVWWTSYTFKLGDPRPAFLRWLDRNRSDDLDRFVFYLHVFVSKKPLRNSDPAGKIVVKNLNRAPGAQRLVGPIGSGIYAKVTYQRSNELEFEKTYAAVCNSLRIE